MFEGTVVLINITPVAQGPMQSVNEVRAIPGRGLEGDRYCDHSQPEPRRELTLVEAEAIEAFRSEFKLDFDLGGTRRNVVTRGVPLRSTRATRSTSRQFRPCAEFLIYR